MRWHNGRSRRPRNLQPENASKGSVTKKDEGAAHSIQAGRSLLQQRPDTFAQTFFVILILRLQKRRRTIHSGWQKLAMSGPLLPSYPYHYESAFCMESFIPTRIS